MLYYTICAGQLAGREGAGNGRGSFSKNFFYTFYPVKETWVRRTAVVSTCIPCQMSECRKKAKSRRAGELTDDPRTASAHTKVEELTCQLSSIALFFSSHTFCPPSAERGIIAEVRTPPDRRLLSIVLGATSIVALFFIAPLEVPDEKYFFKIFF